jgi:hypothetical protein
MDGWVAEWTKIENVLKIPYSNKNCHEIALISAFIY